MTEMNGPGAPEGDTGAAATPPEPEAPPAPQVNSSDIPDAPPASTEPPAFAESPASPAVEPAAQPPSPPPPAPVVPAPVPVPTQAPAAAPAAAPVRRGRSLSGTLSRIVAFLFGILQALLFVRIVLLLLNANLDNEIVDWVISVTEPFVAPFRGILGQDEITGAQGSVLDIAAIVALIAWTLVETLIVSVLGLFGRRRGR